MRVFIEDLFIIYNLEPSTSPFIAEKQRNIYKKYTVSDIQSERETSINPMMYSTANI